MLIIFTLPDKFRLPKQGNLAKIMERLLFNGFGDSSGYVVYEFGFSVCLGRSSEDLVSAEGVWFGERKYVQNRNAGILFLSSTTTLVGQMGSYSMPRPFSPVCPWTALD